MTIVEKHVNPDLKDLQTKERNVFIFWDDLSKNISPWQQLCFETIKQNKGEFDLHLITMNNFKDYLSSEERIPEWQYDKSMFKWPGTRKDVILFSIVAKYGGVAMDFMVLLPGRLEQKWNTMKDSKQEVFFYVYDPSTDDDQFARVYFFMAAKHSKIMRTYSKQVLEKSKIVVPKKQIEDGFFYGCKVFDPILKPIWYFNEGIIDKSEVEIIPKGVREFGNLNEWGGIKEILCNPKSPSVGVKVFGHGGNLKMSSRDELLDPKTNTGKVFGFAQIPDAPKFSHEEICPSGQSGQSGDIEKIIVVISITVLGLVLLIFVGWKIWNSQHYNHVQENEETVEVFQEDKTDEEIEESL